MFAREKHAIIDFGGVEYMVAHKPKAIVNTSRDGLKFWVDADSRKVLTNQPDTYLEEVRYGPMGGVFRRLVMYIEGHPIEFSGPDDMPYEFIMERNQHPPPIMLSTWKFSGLSTRGNHFTSRAQQDQAVRLITEMLSNFNGGWNGARRGESSFATVEFSDEFQQALSDGHYIKGECVNGDL